MPVLMVNSVVRAPQDAPTAQLVTTVQMLTLFQVNVLLARSLRVLMVLAVLMENTNGAWFALKAATAAL